jgi:hypothetical protein
LHTLGQYDANHTTHCEEAERKDHNDYQKYFFALCPMNPKKIPTPVLFYCDYFYK